MYAYEQGYHGQGVTIVNREIMLASHEDLDANVLTMSVDYGWEWDRFATQPTIVLTGVTVRLRSSGEIVSDPTLTISYHGTNSGGLIAAERNGISTIGISTITVRGRALSVALGSHGVAPSAKIIPLPEPSFLGGEWDTSWHEWLAQSTVHIVNGSHRPTFASVNLTTGAVTYSGDGSPRRDIYTIFIGQDIVFLYANGNASVDASTCCNTLLAPAVPAWYPELEPNWLAVTWSSPARDNRLAGPATPCGNRMMWCIVAPGQPTLFPSYNGGDLKYNHISTPDGPDDDSYNPLFVGSSASTPHVAGALAVLKSAMPMMPMTVIRAILLDTATDLTPDDGQRQDEVYGWGLVNISAGIDRIETMETAGGTLLRDLRGRLPAEFSHLRGRMDSVSVAVKITEDSFYNLALGSLLSSAGGGESSAAEIGGAAKGIMADSALRYRGASAFGDSENGFGFRYGGGDDSFFYTAEFSRGARREGFAGSDFGALGSVSSRTHGGKVRLNSQIGGGVSAFGEYEYEDINANVGGGLIAEIRGAKSDGWTAGLEYADMFSFGDRLHFALREEARISGGEMILEYLHADGDFYDAFLGESEQTIRTVRTAIPLKQRRTHIWTAGYGRDYDGGGFAAAAEWNARSGDKAISAEWRIDL